MSPGLIHSTRFISLGATGGVTGVVSNVSGGAPVSGGVVQLVRNGTVVDTSIPDSSGVYTFSGTQVNDVVRNQPKGAFCVADAGEFTVSPGSTQDFSVQAAHYWTDFQSFTTDAQVNAYSGSDSAAFWYDGGIAGGSAGNHDNGGTTQAGGGTITLQSTAGPSGSKCVRQFHPQRISSSSLNTASTYPRINPNGSLVGDWFIRRHEKLSDGWLPGGGGVTGTTANEKKHMFWDFGLSLSGSPNHTYGSVPQVQFLYNNASGGTAIADSYVMQIKLVDYKPGGYSGSWVGPTPSAFGSLGPGFDDVWHTFVYGLEGFGVVDEPTLSLWVDGVLVVSLTAPFVPVGAVGGQATGHPDAGKLAQSENVFAIQFGGQYNNGPDVDTWEDYREFGVYRSRPSLIAGLAV